MIKGIIFDLDGTLIDSETFYVNGTIEWLSKCGIDIDFKTVSGIIGKTMEDTYSYVSLISGLSFDEVKKRNEEYFNIVNPLDFKTLVFKDVKNCFEELKNNNYRICICSMSPKDYIKKFVDECDLNKYVDLFYSGEECKNTKPDPEVYNKTINKLGLEPKEVLIVEDAFSGIQSGVASGAYVVARNDAKFGINQNNALCIFEDLIELNRIITEINNGKYD